MPTRTRSFRSRGLKLAAATVTLTAVIAILVPAAGSAAPIFTGTFPNSFSFAPTASFKFEAGKGTASEVICKVTFTGSGALGSLDTGSFESEPSCFHLPKACEAAEGGNRKFGGTFELVQINSTTTGLLLSPKEMSFVCGTETFKFKGRLLGTVSPLKTTTNHFTLTFAAESGHQQYRECEVGPQCGGLIQLDESVNGAAYEPAFLVTKLELATEQATKIETKPIFTGVFPNTFSLSATGFVRFDNPRVEGGVEEHVIACKEMPGSGSISTATTGTFKSELLGCHWGVVKCEALGGGAPKFEGTFELVQLEPSKVGVVFVPKELAFSCPSEGIERVIRYRGAVAGTINPVNTETKSLTVAFEVSGAYNFFHECEVGLLCGKDIRIEGSYNGGIFIIGKFEGTLNLAAAATTKVLR
jgi:hypothetical protein